MLQTAKFHNPSRRGVTLIELLVAIAIFSVIMGGVMLMFTSVTNTVRRSYATMDVYERARGALSRGTAFSELDLLPAQRAIAALRTAGPDEQAAARAAVEQALDAIGGAAR